MELPCILGDVVFPERREDVVADSVACGKELAVGEKEEVVVSVLEGQAETLGLFEFCRLWRCRNIVCVVVCKIQLADHVAQLAGQAEERCPTLRLSRGSGGAEIGDCYGGLVSAVAVVGICEGHTFVDQTL